VSRPFTPRATIHSSRIALLLRRFVAEQLVAGPTAGNGSFVSKPLLWKGGELTINADTLKTAGEATSTGAVAIYILEEGHRTPSSVPFSGNKTDATVEWPAGGRMDSVKGKTVQLEVVLTGAAKLYALRGDFAWK
jgi:hypothetical protein